MMKTVLKTIQFETMPKYIRGLFQMRNTERNLQGSKKLVIPYVNATTYDYTPSDILLQTCGTN